MITWVEVFAVLLAFGRNAVAFFLAHWELLFVLAFVAVGTFAPSWEWRASANVLGVVFAAFYGGKHGIAL